MDSYGGSYRFSILLHIDTFFFQDTRTKYIYTVENIKDVLLNKIMFYSFGVTLQLVSVSHGNNVPGTCLKVDGEVK